jgi:hypothetical protein
MLEIVVIAFERSEGNVESYRHIGFEHCTLGEDLEDSHVLSIKILSFLGDPAQSEPALHFVGNFDLPLSAHGEHLAIPKIKSVVADGHKLIAFSLEKELFLQHIRMLSNLEIRLVEILFHGVLTPSLGQLQQKIILDILKFDGRDPALDDPLPKGIYMLLQQGQRSDQQIVTSPYKIDIEQRMISDQTVHTLIVRHRISRPEFYYYLHVCVARKSAFGLVKLEYVASVSEEFEFCVQLGVVAQG